MPEFIWQSSYAVSDFVLRKLRLFVYRLVAFVALSVALGSFVVFALRSLPEFFNLSWQIFFEPAPAHKFFWAAVLLLMYAWYRFEREQTWYPELPEVAELIEVEKYLAEEVWRVIEKAYRYAQKLRHSQVDPLHLLAAALAYPTGQRVFSRLGVSVDKLLTTLRNALAMVARGPLPILSPASQAVLKTAGRLALARKARHIEANELLTALAKSESRVQAVLEELAIPPQAIENITTWFALRRKLRYDMRRRSRRASARPKHALDRAYLAVATPFLNRFSRDLTVLAAKGYLHPCVGRQAELEEMFRIIEGGRESVMLIGEPGVGKSSMLDGLAQAMVAEEVPRVLQDKHLLALSLPQLLSGATASQASERLLHVVMEALRARNIVLVIEHLDQLVALPGSDKGGLTLGEVLVGAMAKYRLIVVGTTTKTDWQKTVSGTLLGQAFQPVEVPELDDNRAIQVLESQAPLLEAEHNVYFTYGALEAAVQLSRRYLPERYLPEKAIKIIEEVAVFVAERRAAFAAVFAEDVSQVVADKVHIPLTQVTQSERQKLLKLEQILHERIVGQTEAVGLVAKALRRARVNLRDQKRPIASFLFLGPTGVGKTELAKVVAAEYFGGEDRMIRLDMSEYQTSESLYRLIGAPAGVGEATGLLTEAVRRHPYALILLDEIEKAHPNILNVFLQLLDDGRLTDASGRTIDFTNCIIIATSNAGTTFIQDSLGAGVALDKIRQQLMEKELRPYFRPELLNRFDGVVVFKPLSPEHVEQVAGLLLNKMAKNLEVKGIHLKASAEAVKELAHKGFDPLFGARPLRRVIQEDVDNALATYLLSGKLARRDVVVLEPGGVVRVEKAEKL